MKITIYHNPSCSNSRGALAILRDAEARGAIALTVIDYLKTPPGPADLNVLAAALQATDGTAWPGLRDGMLRTKETLYADLGLAGASDAALLDAVAAHPILLNRPIVVVEGRDGTRARLCRPPQIVETLL